MPRGQNVRQLDVRDIELEELCRQVQQLQERIAMLRIL